MWGCAIGLRAWGCCCCEGACCVGDCTTCLRALACCCCGEGCNTGLRAWGCCCTWACRVGGCCVRTSAAGFCACRCCVRACCRASLRAFFEMGCACCVAACCGCEAARMVLGRRSSSSLATSAPQKDNRSERDREQCDTKCAGLTNNAHRCYGFILAGRLERDVHREQSDAHCAARM